MGRRTGTMRVMLRALVFDLDDTLLATARARVRANRVLRGAGVDPNRMQAVADRWRERYVGGEISRSELRRSIWAELGFDEPAGVAVDAAWRRILFDPNLRTGVRALLVSARRAGLRTAILTNGTVERQGKKVARHGLAELVDVVAVSEEFGFAKPDCAAFHHVLDALSTEPRAAAMIGDDLVNDVDGALAVGFARVAWLNTSGVPHPDPRVVTVRRPNEVLAALGVC